MFDTNYSDRLCLYVAVPYVSRDERQQPALSVPVWNVNGAITPGVER